MYVDSEGEEVEWPAFTDLSGREKYLVWSHPITPKSIGFGLRPHRVELWNFDVPDIIERFERAPRDEL